MSALNGVDQVLRNLDAYLERQIQGTREGLQAGSAIVAAAGQGSTAYQDESGATRGSTTAFVVGLGEDGSAEATQAKAVAETLSPGSSLSLGYSLRDPQNKPRIVLTTFTRWSGFLAMKYAGLHDPIGPAMRVSAIRIRSALVAALRRRA